MKRFCMDCDLGDENIKMYKKYFSSWNDDEIESLIKEDRIVEIWNKLIQKELLADVAQVYLMDSQHPFQKYLYEDEIDNFEKVCDIQEKKRKRLELVNVEEYLKRYVVTDKEDCELSAKLIIAEQKSDRYKAEQPYIPIDTLRLMSAENFLLDILLCISFSIRYYMFSDKYVPLCKPGDPTELAVWQTFIKKGEQKFHKLDGEKKNVFLEFVAKNENEFFSSEKHTTGFIEKTKQVTPISGKLKYEHKQVPEVEDIVPNVFKAFIVYPEFRDNYKATRKENKYSDKDLFQAENLIPRENIHEVYMFEEISGKKLGKHIYSLISSVFKLVNYDVFNSGVRNELERFVNTLLKCKGVYTRIALADCLIQMRNDQFLYKISDKLSHRERTEKYVAKVLERYTEEATNLARYGNDKFEILCKELYYILWRKSKENKQDLLYIKNLCDRYVSRIKEVDCVEIENEKLYGMIQKLIMQGIMQEKILI